MGSGQDKYEKRHKAQGARCRGKKHGAEKLSSHRASRHMPSASVGQYARLSFVVRVKGTKDGARKPALPYRATLTGLPCGVGDITDIRP